MANPLNSFNVTGRLVSDPKIVDNSDGSKRTYVKLALARNYKTNDEYGADFIDFEGFIPAPKNGKTFGGVYNYMTKGNLVGINFELRSTTYQAKDENGQLLVKEDGSPKMTGRQYNQIREIKPLTWPEKAEDEDVASEATEA